MKKETIPWWVKTHRFIVVKSLLPLIQGYSEQKREYYCYIVSQIIVHTKANPSFYAHIGRSLWLDKIKSNYKVYISQLRQWKIIDINDSYSIEEHFTKGYRLHDSVINDEKVKVSFTKKRVRPMKDHSMVTDKVTDFVYSNLQRIGAHMELKLQPNEVDEVEAEEYMRKIWFQVFNLKYGKKVRRLFHTIITMPRLCRINLMLKERPTEPLYEYDIKSCHPVLLLTFISDPNEKARYTELLDTDIYTTIANARKVTKDRDDIKTDFLYFLNGGIKNYFYDYFQLHFPKFTTILSSLYHTKEDDTQNTIASILQNLEADIMVNAVVNTIVERLNKDFDADTLYIPCHDGYMGIAKDEHKICSVIRQYFKDLTGYNVTITRKDLSTGIKDEVIL